MIVCNVLALTAICVQVHKIFSTTITSAAFIVMAIITLPIVGIVADTCVGRFKVIQASIVFLMVSTLLNMSLIVLKVYFPGTAETIFVLCTTGLSCIGASFYVVCVFPFLADQLIGASGGQLSFVVYWIMWGFGIAYSIVLLKSNSSDYFYIVLETLPFLCLIVAAFIFRPEKKVSVKLHFT